MWYMCKLHILSNSTFHKIGYKIQWIPFCGFHILVTTEKTLEANESKRWRLTNLSGANLLSCLRRKSLRTDLLSPNDDDDKQNQTKGHCFRYCREILRHIGKILLIIDKSQSIR